jgi:uncharacterized protein (DUF362 family)
MRNSLVAIGRAGVADYLEIAPFHPSTRYPEAPFADVGFEPNPAYDAVRFALNASGLDPSNAGTAAWNPLGTFVRPGDTVMLKPNLVKEHHPRDPRGWRYVLTHGSVIRAVADYVVIALGGRGRIWLADAPQTDSSWNAIVKILQLDRLADFYRRNGVEFELVDLRQQEWTQRDGVIIGRRELAGDPRGYVAFDLGSASELHGHGGEGHYYGADYVTSEVNAHHSGSKHEYLIGGSAIRADVFINLPKLKTHKKAGITCSLKNLVGINGDKNWLPHHTMGPPSQGGDEVPALSLRRSLERRAVGAFRATAISLPVLGPELFRRAKSVGRIAFGDTETVVRNGNWHGNDTTWRMCLDLNKILLYGDADGRLRAPNAAGRKRYLTFVDGIVAGEGRGPMNPDPVAARLVVIGCDPVAVDAVCGTLMGFDVERIPIVREAFRARGWPLTEVAFGEIATASNEPAWNGRLVDLPHDSLLQFQPHFGWTGQVESAWRKETRVDDAR